MGMVACKRHEGTAITPVMFTGKVGPPCAAYPHVDLGWGLPFFLQ